MSAADRSAADYAHRGQRIRMTVPRALTVNAGDAIRITFIGEHAWEMPATVVSVAADYCVVEPGAAVKHPSKWYIVAPAIEETTPVAPQMEMFA